MPYYFNGYAGDYTGWQKRGQRMMRRAAELDPENMFAVALACIDDANVFADACKIFWSQITPEQWGTGEVPKYFFYILNGPLSYPNAYENNRVGEGHGPVA